MKFVFAILLFFLVFNPVAASPDLSHVRNLFAKASVEEKYCKELLSLLAGYSEKSNPLLAGYKAAATMMMAQHVFNPVNKLTYFNKGKKLLEKAVAADPGNIELRYIRYSIQTNAPGFLGYRGAMASDRRFILQNINGVQDAQLLTMIKQMVK